MVVIGIKCANNTAHLAEEFYLQLASPVHYERQIGVFVQQVPSIYLVLPIM